MPKFCANLTMLYTEHDFLDRFAAASADGFAGVEYMFPYAFRTEDLAEALERNGLVQVLHNLPAGDWEGASAASPASLTGLASSRRASAAAWRMRAPSAARS